MGISFRIRSRLAVKTTDCSLSTSEAHTLQALPRALLDIISSQLSVYFCGDLQLKREKIGDLSCEMIPRVFQSFAQGAGVTLHVDVIRGENDDHKAESAFKALALAIREAIQTDGSDDTPSTKSAL
ncbi:BZ3500_MvSof-1268-A1-R1_Chr8-2g10295 [Microbotryum saponariae]|uniref:BZ3500_MvSof-1268-A1-R1_Chr8-2g10295 protein n=1 Tax=Microbotryum saponariae TaxID=289078 RepID=A0A2X0N4S0_9BASI|nr:BZ3500_MvSof-1268-A1-R1_Chr8-2g10295 [Microbotryum saponariae]SDA02122.1 BZ3501_MvSof-1269-A2-R1_Chr8-2g10044 [Microbotryum saponariae]